MQKITFNGTAIQKQGNAFFISQTNLVKIFSVLNTSTATVADCIAQRG